MDFWKEPFVWFVLAGALSLGIIIFKLRHPSKINATLLAMAEERVRESGPQPCPCGAAATEPAPTIKRGRGGIAWLRDFFGMPPMWTRETDHFKPHVFCRSHAHVADEMVNQALLDLRARYANLNVESSAFIAGFEQEGLLEKVKMSLTEGQKKAQARAKMAASPGLRAVPSLRTGTDEETSG